MFDYRVKYFFITNLIFFTALSFTISCNTIYSQARTNKSIINGLNALYNFNFQNSNRVFSDFIKLYPENPSGYYFKSIQYLWYYIDGRDDEHLDLFTSYTDTAINKAEILFEKDSADIFTNYILGSVYSQRAIAYARGEDYLNALWATKKFHYYLSNAVAMDTLYYDAYLGLGLYDFAVSQTPQAWKWALDISGITGDKKAGIEYFKSASKKGKYSKVDAQFYLSQVYAEFIRDYKSSEKLLQNLLNQYPKNLLFRYALANLQVKKYDLRSAKKTYRTVITSRDSMFTQLKNYSRLSIGDIYYSENNFDSAKTYYHYFLENAKDDHLKGITALKLGLCYLFSGDSDFAAAYFDQTSMGNMDIDEDVYAKDIGEQYLDNLPDENRLKLLKIKNLIDAGKFSAGIDSLEKFSNLFLSDTLRAEMMLYFSDANYHLRNYKKSVEYALAVINFDNCESWVKPFACYYAARASKELKNYIDAKLFIEYANNYSNFYFENKLKDLLNSLVFQMQN
jgi:predicted negative regulator of RcsB-dependent stress response